MTDLTPRYYFDNFKLRDIQQAMELVQLDPSAFQSTEPIEVAGLEIKPGEFKSTRRDSVDKVMKIVIDNLGLPGEYLSRKAVRKALAKVSPDSTPAQAGEAVLERIRLKQTTPVDHLDVRDTQAMFSLISEQVFTKGPNHNGFVLFANPPDGYLNSPPRTRAEGDVPIENIWVDLSKLRSSGSIENIRFVKGIVDDPRTHQPGPVLSQEQIRAFVTECMDNPRLADHQKAFPELVEYLDVHDEGLNGAAMLKQVAKPLETNYLRPAGVLQLVTHEPAEKGYGDYLASWVSIDLGALMRGEENPIGLARGLHSKGGHRDRAIVKEPLAKDQWPTVLESLPVPKDGSRSEYASSLEMVRAELSAAVTGKTTQPGLVEPAGQLPDPLAPLPWSEARERLLAVAEENWPGLLAPDQVPETLSPGTDLSAIPAGVWAAADLRGADLRGARFGEELRDVTFVGCNLSGCVFEELFDCKFDGCQLDGIELPERVSALTFQNCDLTPLDFSGKKLFWSGFENCRFGSLKDLEIKTECRFQGCDLSGAVLENWSGRGGGRAIFDGCNLNDVRLKDFGMEVTSFRNCNMDRLDAGAAKYYEYKFDSCRMREANFGGCRLRPPLFQQCDLTGARFDGARMVDGYTRSPMTFFDCRLKDTSLRGLVLCGSLDFAGSQLLGTDLTEIQVGHPDEKNTHNVGLAFENARDLSGMRLGFANLKEIMEPYNYSGMRPDDLQKLCDTLDPEQVVLDEAVGMAIGQIDPAGAPAGTGQYGELTINGVVTEIEGFIPVGEVKMELTTDADGNALATVHQNGAIPAGKNEDYPFPALDLWTLFERWHEQDPENNPVPATVEIVQNLETSGPGYYTAFALNKPQDYPSIEQLSVTTNIPRIGADETLYLYFLEETYGVRVQSINLKQTVALVDDGGSVVNIGLKRGTPQDLEQLTAALNLN